MSTSAPVATQPTSVLTLIDFRHGPFRSYSSTVKRAIATDILNQLLMYPTKNASLILAVLAALRNL